MVPGENGFVPKQGVLKKLLRGIYDLHRPDFPDWDLIEFSPVLDSSNIGVQDWNKIGRTIYEKYDLYDGFVVLHGTDTMAYSASALSFMLEGLNKPVIFTGSQIPLYLMRSDGMDNLVSSILVASSEEIAEVCLYFSGKLLRGNRSKKVSSDQFDAFDSPNYPHLAEAGITINYNVQFLRKKEERELRFCPFRELPIGVLSVFPGLNFKLFDEIIVDKLKGVVIEAFGAGNIPHPGDDELAEIGRRAYEKGTIITVCTQCQRGAVTLGAYEASRTLIDAGVVSGGDMTIEAAVTKLYYLYSCGHEKEKIKTLMEENLRGERTGRILQ